MKIDFHALMCQLEYRYRAASVSRALSLSLWALASVREAGIDRFNLVRANIQLVFKYSPVQSRLYLVRGTY